MNLSSLVERGRTGRLRQDLTGPESVEKIRRGGPPGGGSDLGPIDLGEPGLQPFTATSRPGFRGVVLTAKANQFRFRRQSAPRITLK